METRFRALNFLCKLQVFIGGLVILGGVVFGFLNLLDSADHPAGSSPLTGLLIAVGVVFVGVQIIAMAQVYQCLMQIEINTRPVHATPLEPRAEQQIFTIAGEPRR
ncbi:MAG TPA: hypothetical protein VJX69_13395 [Terriglobales bacterium]|nr:hypothetical protein [Terriglobales bacterium]